MNRWNDEVLRARKRKDTVENVVGFLCVLAFGTIVAYIVCDTISCEYVRLLELLPWTK